MKERYIHYRRPVVALEPDGVRVSTCAPCGGLTAIYRRNPDNTLTVAFAQCQKMDHYEKKVGRTVASARLAENDDVWHLSGETENVFERVLQTVMAVKGLRRCLKAEVR